MAFYVKISVVFLLWIFLLSCSSHANDHLPEVRVGDRKVLGFPRFSSLGKDLPGTSWSHDTSIPKGLYDTSRSHEDNRINPDRFYGDHTTRPSVDNSFGRDGRSGFGLDSESGPAEAAAAKMGETIAFKLFGANGKKGFRIGWKLGKKIYKLDKKCQELEKDLDFTCDEQSTLTNNPEMSCVLQFAQKTKTVSCNEEVSGTPESIPCFYYDGTFYKYDPYAKKLINVNLHRVTDCAY